jgi:hypothetical protein
MVQDSEAEALRRVPVGGAHPEDELGLLGLARLDHERDARLGRRRAHGGDAARPARKARPDPLGEALVVEVSRGRDHHVAGQVVGVEERTDLRDGHLSDHLRLAEDLAPERVAREHRGREKLLDHVRGLVAVHEHLF